MKRNSELQLSYLEEEEEENKRNPKQRENYLDSEFTQLVDNFLYFEKKHLIIDQNGYSFKKNRFDFFRREDLSIIRQLGKGSSAKVYLVELKSATQKKFALKSFNGYEKCSRVQLINDIENYRSAKNKCPFIINFYGAFYEAPVVNIILEYMNAGSLKEFISQKKLKKEIIVEKQVRRIVEQLLHGLSFIHNVIKRVHLDLKPENVLLEENLSAKISDFGVSKMLEFTNENILNFAGTYLYMSPERLLNKNFTANADIWSLGVILYEMLILEYPFAHKKSYIDLMQFLNEKKQIIDSNLLCQKYSANCIDFLGKCLDFDEMKRPKAMELLLHPWFYQ